MSIILTFIEEHRRHLTHLYPLHNVKVINVTRRPLCGNMRSTDSHLSVIFTYQHCTENSGKLTNRQDGFGLRLRPTSDHDIVVRIL